MDVFRRRKCTQKEIDDLKMLVLEVGIDRITQNQSYRLLYYYTASGDSIAWNHDHWRSKAVVESKFERCDHPEI
jgi:hypothetical protein